MEVQLCIQKSSDWVLITLIRGMLGQSRTGCPVSTWSWTTAATHYLHSKKDRQDGTKTSGATLSSCREELTDIWHSTGIITRFYEPEFEPYPALQEVQSFDYNERQRLCCVPSLNEAQPHWLLASLHGSKMKSRQSKITFYLISNCLQLQQGDAIIIRSSHYLVN